MTDTTTATDTTEAQNTTAAEGSGGADLDALLASYDAEGGNESQQAAATTTKPADDDRVAALEQHFNELRREIVKERVDTGFERSVKILKSNGLDSLSERALRGLIREKAEEDPRFAIAFHRQRSDPKGWEKVLKAFAKEETAARKKEPDEAVTRDRAAVRAAVQGTSISEPREGEKSAESIRKMSKTEFRDYQRSIGLAT